MATIADAATIISTAEVTARRERKRELSRERQERQRERRAAERITRAIARAELERLEAIENEEKAEMVAPSVLRDAVLRPDGSMLRGPVVRVKVGRPMIGQDFPFASSRSRRAAARLRKDWQDVGGGINVAAVDYLRSSGAGDGQGAHSSVRAQINTRARLEGALTFLGAFTPMVSRLVFDCVPVTIWAAEENERRGSEAKDPLTGGDVVRLVIAAFVRLADFYDLSLDKRDGM